MKYKKIIIFIIIALITIFFIVAIGRNKNSNRFLDSNNVIEQLKNIEFTDIELKNISVVINNNEIDNNSIEFQKGKIETYTDEEKEALDIKNPIIEAIKMEVVLNEAKKENINPDFDEEKMKSVANAMYENSDKSLSKEEYENKWVKIQKDNEVKSIYMAGVMKKIIAGGLETDNQKVQKLIEEYKDNLASDNRIRKIYEAYVESLINDYNIIIKENENEIYKNYN